MKSADFDRSGGWDYIRNFFFRNILLRISDLPKNQNLSALPCRYVMCRVVVVVLSVVFFFQEGPSQNSRGKGIRGIARCFEKKSVRVTGHIRDFFWALLKCFNFFGKKIRIPNVILKRKKTIGRNPAPPN